MASTARPQVLVGSNRPAIPDLVLAVAALFVLESNSPTEGWITTAVLCLFATISQAPDSRIAVLPAQIDSVVRGEIPDIFDDYLLTAVQDVHGGSVIGQDDINTMLGFERQKELAGCDDLGCLAEIGGALGAPLQIRSGASGARGTDHFDNHNHPL